MCLIGSSFQDVLLHKLCQLKYCAVLCRHCNDGPTLVTLNLVMDNFKSLKKNSYQEFSART